jgi:hypothetical protein
MNTRVYLLPLAGLACLSSFATEPPAASAAPAFHELMGLLATRRHGGAVRPCRPRLQIRAQLDQQIRMS